MRYYSQVVGLPYSVFLASGILLVVVVLARVLRQQNRKRCERNEALRRERVAKIARVLDVQPNSNAPRQDVQPAPAVNEKSEEPSRIPPASEKTPHKKAFHA